HVDRFVALRRERFGGLDDIGYADAPIARQWRIQCRIHQAAKAAKHPDAVVERFATVGGGHRRIVRVSRSSKRYARMGKTGSHTLSKPPPAIQRHRKTSFSLIVSGNAGYRTAHPA